MVEMLLSLGIDKLYTAQAVRCSYLDFSQPFPYPSTSIHSLIQPIASGGLYRYRHLTPGSRPGLQQAAPLVLACVGIKSDRSNNLPFWRGDRLKKASNTSLSLSGVCSTPSKGAKETMMHHRRLEPLALDWN